MQLRKNWKYGAGSRTGGNAFYRQPRMQLRKNWKLSQDLPTPHTDRLLMQLRKNWKMNLRWSEFSSRQIFSMQLRKNWKHSAQIAMGYVKPPAWCNSERIERTFAGKRCAGSICGWCNSERIESWINTLENEKRSRDATQKELKARAGRRWRPTCTGCNSERIESERYSAVVAYCF